MALKTFIIGLTIVFGCASAQNRYRVCMPPSQETLCQTLQLGDRVQCEVAKTRIDCALKLARGEADLGAFSEEEMVLLSQQQPDAHRVIGDIRHVSRQEDFAFEAVAVVSVDHTGGLEGLRGGGLCHPGFDIEDQRWSPRVLRQLEQAVARTDICDAENLPGRTFEELEVATLSSFFGGACRPGPWSHNITLDARLKQEFPNLCHLCNAEGNSESCNGYAFDMGVRISGVDNNNRHIQALECLVRHRGNVSYVAWQHVRDYFQHRAINDVNRFALLCDDGRIEPLNEAALASTAAACSWVRQPWGALVASTNQAQTLLSEIRVWWQDGLPPTPNTWQNHLFQALVGHNHRVTFLPGNNVHRYVSNVRNLTDIDSISTCMPSPRWCTISAQEFEKCQWIRRAAFTLGIEPVIACQQRQTVFHCMDDIRLSRADFISLDSNYGYLARIGYNLGSVKLLQNSNADSSRIAALIREDSVVSNEITRFENLRGTRACFPEFGGIAYMAFVRTGHERGVISESDCDYARVVGEFFSGACAPGALDPTHNINPNNQTNDFDINLLCTVCRNRIETPGPFPDDTCAADDSNLFYGTNGTILCLNDPENQVAFIETQNLQRYISELRLEASNFRALCRNNTVALTPGVNLDDDCLLALVVNEEVLTRRNDPQFNSLASLLELLENHFGFNAAFVGQLINLQIFSPFNETNNLLFLDSALGFTEPSIQSSHIPARNYIELFSHLEACTDGAPGLANSKTVFSIFGVIILNIMIRWVL